MRRMRMMIQKMKLLSWLLLVLCQHGLLFSIHSTAFTPILIMSPYLSRRGHPRILLPPTPTIATGRTIRSTDPTPKPFKPTKTKKIEDYLYTDYEPKVKKVLLRLDEEERANPSKEEVSEFALDLKEDFFQEKEYPREIPSLKDRLLYQHLCQEEEREALLGIQEEDNDDPPPFNPKKFRRDPRELTFLEHVELWPPWVMWQDRQILHKDMEIASFGQTLATTVAVSSIFVCILLFHWELTLFIFRRRHLWGLLQPGMKFVFRHDRRYSYMEQTVAKVTLQS
eukprot:Nitzschia sp. Nitz4//scaffold34_size148208//86974//87933//NITZ4_002986-RA/size148208-augustus-gene-0.202-mRNA-1//-1//CDS//3329548813//7945//frame0